MSNKEENKIPEEDKSGGDSSREENGTVEESTEENTEFTTEDMQCRFYRNEWPDVNDLVVVSKLK